jgi:hypothetical protein
MQASKAENGSATGPLVIKFLMEGLPGNSVVSMAVQFQAMFKRNTGAAW